MTAFPYLDRPLQLGRSLQLKNRIAHAAILTRMISGQTVTPAFSRYHENRAIGGAAMIVIEAVNALPWQRGRDAYLNAYDDTDFAGLKHFAERVQGHDCRLFAQIQDRGRGNYTRTRVDRPYGPSALPDDLSGAVPHPLSIMEIEDIVAAFGTAAARLERAGFDGVEISAGHGHLFHQFLSAHSNRREDAYGGSFDNRLRLLADVINEIRRCCSNDFVIGVKLPAEDGMPNGIDFDSAGRITETIATPERIGYLSFAWGSQSETLHWHVPDGHSPRSTYAAKIAALRQRANGIPVMSLGRIVDPNEAEAILSADQADFVGIGRAMITDSAWASKALSGRGYAIRPCVSCNTCWASIADTARLVCDNNPALATEAEISPDPALHAPSVHLPGRRRRVVVIGAGVAGLEAASTAAAQGHEVVLFGASAEVGGRTRLCAQLPGSDGLAGVFDFQWAAARANGVRIELGHKASAADVSGLAPDAVVLSSGAELGWPDRLPPSIREVGAAVDVVSLMHEIGTSPRHIPGTAILIDEDQGAAVYNAAEWLSDRFDHVELVTSHPMVAGDVPLVTRQGVYRRLANRRIGCRTMSEVDADLAELEQGRVGVRHIYTGDRSVISGVAVLTYAAHRVPRLELLPELRRAGYEPQPIGDAFAPRALLQAVSEGYAAGLAI